MEQSFTINATTLFNTFVFITSMVVFVFAYNKNIKKSVNKDDMDAMKAEIKKDIEALNTRCKGIEDGAKSDKELIDEKLTKILYILIEDGKK